MAQHHTAPTTTGETDGGHTGCGRCVGRRTALMGMGAVGVAGLLAACGGGDSEPSTSGAPPATEPEAEPSAEATTPAEEPSEEPSAPPEEPDEPAADALASTADVPVGSGFINDGAGVVVTQPTAGTFLGFSATCTHQGCAVTEIEGDVITCPCHGSQYSAMDGSVVTGPATQPLAPVAVVVQGDQVLPA
ncbi:Rieske (2Fe-2S) protein [Jiangella mangrovi]|uniref:Cytochrome bc1 complex Rieske iron-sulfur subunit n=1 Tax=Jiangella mangrovi TaxID=1524084 RepID=A0A7W9GT80_9ACTN|nr:Rieske (2Fe-2S) protein [Jiangella mangrovi]MBB5789619.1 Rieske Fe-S protein [Jiangella mangrovi]